MVTLTNKSLEKPIHIDTPTYVLDIFLDLFLDLFNVVTSFVPSPSFDHTVKLRELIDKFLCER